MTEPTDPELLAECDRVSHIADAGQRRLACLRAALAKWGTPPAVAGEPVFAFRRKGLDDFCTCTEERYAELSAKPNLFETRIFYTAPQPTQAQAVERGPLTPEQVVDAFCKQPHTVQFVEAFIKGVRFAEQYHGIKGGQHGTE